ncbi:thiamine diphosphokinase [Candidatus Parcubacteria bacterium]|nr:thiamine diphosphokinase [Candidatus Parcubacteria bacterium]
MHKFAEAVIFVNGNLAKLDFTKNLINASTYLIGADGGADKIYELGYKPHAVIGDFDSIQNIPDKIKKLKPKISGTQKIIDGIIYRKYPTDKFYLDTELAIDFAIEKGLNEIIILNALGDETDHVLGIIFMLHKPKYAGKNIKIIQPNQELFIVSDEVKITGTIGQKLSLIPLFGEVKVKSSSGLKYDPSKYKMSMQTNSGISNELVDDSAKLKITSGKFLVVLSV